MVSAKRISEAAPIAAVLSELDIISTLEERREGSIESFFFAVDEVLSPHSRLASEGATSPGQPATLT